MSPLAVRRALHGMHALASLALLATGALLGLPDLRARLIGGYGPRIAAIHEWLAWLYLAAPLLAVGLRGRPLLADLRRRLGPPDPVNWRKLHIVSTGVSGALLVASGALLWTDANLPLTLLDAATEVHIAFSWLLAAQIPLHLFLARGAIASRLRRGFDPQTGAEFDPAWGVDNADPPRSPYDGGHN